MSDHVEAAYDRMEQRMKKAEQEIPELKKRIEFLEQHNQELSAALVRSQKLVRRYKREC